MSASLDYATIPKRHFCTIVRNAHSCRFLSCPFYLSPRLRNHFNPARCSGKEARARRTKRCRFFRADGIYTASHELSYNHFSIYHLQSSLSLSISVWRGRWLPWNLLSLAPLCVRDFEVELYRFLCDFFILIYSFITRKLVSDSVLFFFFEKKKFFLSIHIAVYGRIELISRCFCIYTCIFRNSCRSLDENTIVSMIMFSYKPQSSLSYTTPSRPSSELYIHRERESKYFSI